jgi:hypothetical protein
MSDYLDWGYEGDIWPDELAEGDERDGWWNRTGDDRAWSHRLHEIDELDR